MILAGLSAFLLFLGMYVYVPILTPYAVSMGASMTMVGLLVGSYGFSQLLFRIPIGVISDRLGRRKPFVMVGMVCGGLGALGLALSPSAPFLVLSRGVVGLGASFWVTITVLFASYFPMDKSFRAMALVQFAASSSVVLASLIGGFVAGAFGWVAPFYVGAGIGVVGFLVASAVQERKSERIASPSEKRLVVKVTHLGGLMIVSVIAAFVQYAHWSTIFGFSPIKGVELGATKPVLGMLTMLAAGFNVLGLWVGNFTAERFGPRITITLALLLVALSVLWVPFIGLLPILAMSQMLTGLAAGAAFLVLMGLSIRDVPQAERATSMGIFQATYALGMFLGPILAGRIADFFGLNSVFFFTSAVCLLGSFLALKGIRSRRTAAVS